MMRVRRAGERHRLHSGGQNMWLTFYPELRTQPLSQGFGALAALNEGWLPPEGTMLTYSRQGTEIITYVIDGTLSHKDGCSRSHLLRSGDFQRSGVERSDHVSYSNASGRSDLHVVQLSLLADRARQAPRPPEQRSFPPAPRSGLCLVGSGDGRLGSLLLDQDVQIFSGAFAADQKVRYPLGEGRMAWLQIVRGDVTLGDLVLTAGDGVGVSLAFEIDMLTRTPVEFVLVDVAGPPRQYSRPAHGRTNEFRASRTDAAAASAGGLSQSARPSRWAASTRPDRHTSGCIAKPSSRLCGTEHAVEPNRRQPSNAPPREWTLYG